MLFKYAGDLTRLDYKPGEKAEHVWGEGILLARMLLNSEPPGSTHECSQISLVLNEQFELDIGDETMRLTKGDAFYVPAGLRHIIVKVISKPMEIVDIRPVCGSRVPQ
jgi:mannose-6-phosphate isomerase-like protein (cupin superfamily)